MITSSVVVSATTGCSLKTFALVWNVSSISLGTRGQVRFKVNGSNIFATGLYWFLFVPNVG
jgi:hypothetical protein